MKSPFTDGLQFSLNGGNLKSEYLLLSLAPFKLWQYIIPAFLVCSMPLQPTTLVLAAIPMAFSPTNTIDCLATGSQTAFQYHLGARTFLLSLMTLPCRSLA